MGQAGAVVRLLAAEYGVLVLAGLVIGVVPALVAIQPAARALAAILNLASEPRECRLKPVLRTVSYTERSVCSAAFRLSQAKFRIAGALGGQLPWQAMAGIISGLFGCAAACVLLAARAAARRYGPEVLREEV